MTGKQGDAEGGLAHRPMTSTTAPILRQRLQLALLNRHHRQKSLLQKGFTLVELMIVIVIVGILSAVALPNFLSQTDKAKATEAKTGISSIMKQAQASYLEQGTAPATAIQGAEYGAPADDTQKFNYAGSWNDTTNTYTVTATGNTNDDNLNGKKIIGCVDMDTGVTQVTQNLDDTAPTCQ